jgi:uncharacterized protein (TIGR03000 family)
VGWGARPLGWGGWGWGGSGIGLYGLGLGTGLGLGYGVGSIGYGLGGYGLGYGGYIPSYGVYTPGLGAYTAGYGGYSYATPYAGNGFSGPSVPANPPVNPNANYSSPDQPQQAPANDNAAHLMVVVPESAELWFNGTRMTLTGTQREFFSPALTPGKDYTYEIRARWMENGRPVEQNRSVKVQANSYQVVDFTRPQTPETPGR